MARPSLNRPLKIGLWLIAGGWAPLIGVGFVAPRGNPVGLGLLAWVATIPALLLIVIGLCLAVYRRIRGP